MTNALLCPSRLNGVGITFGHQVANDAKTLSGTTGKSRNLGLLGRIGWGTWIRTKIDGVRVRCSTIELFPKSLKARGAFALVGRHIDDLFRGASRKNRKMRFIPVLRLPVAQSRARVERGVESKRLVSLPVMPGTKRMRRSTASKSLSVAALSSTIRSQRPLVL